MSRPAADGYARVYAERLWSLVPAVYRDEDGRAAEPGTLRAFVDAVAEELAVSRRSVDRLGDDSFVETADGWALPYLADLVATRLVSALNPRGRRVDVAKTIYYRRRKGTPRVLEELIGDITGWDGMVAEQFRRLARHRHGLDPEVDALRGRVTRTCPGGWADLRSTRGAELVGGPFDEYHHTPDVRRPRGALGRPGIPKLGLHLYRIPAWPLVRVTPGPGPTTTTRTIDPSGRDVPLFQRRDRPADYEQWRSAREWEVAAPMRCRVLGDADFTVTEQIVADLVTTVALPAAAARDLRRLVGRRFDGPGALATAVASLPPTSASAIQAPAVWQALLDAALVADCGKAALLPGSLEIESAAATPVPRRRVSAGDLSAWSTAATDFRVVVDPERGRLRFIGGAPGAGLVVSCRLGFPGPVGAGPWDRSGDLAPPDSTIAGGGAIGAAALQQNGVAQIADSLSYTGLPPASTVQRLVLQAGDRQRPYIQLGGNWVVFGTLPDTPAVLDGLWLGAAAGPAPIRLRGNWGQVTVRHCTLDPGGTTATGATLTPVPIAIEGDVETLSVEGSICGPIAVTTGTLQTLILRDSIVDARGGQAIQAPLSAVDAARTTVVGRIDCDRINANELLAAGLVDATDLQHGCFRFSAAASTSRVPRRYESHLLRSFAGVFTSLRFGDPGYTQLAAGAPAALARGAQDTSEIGVWSALRNPIRLDGLEAKVGEYAPFGLIPYFALET